jgi:hypothetical protein
MIIHGRRENRIHCIRIVRVERTVVQFMDIDVCKVHDVETKHADPRIVDMVSTGRVLHKIPYRLDGMPLFHNIHHGQGVNMTFPSVTFPLVLEKGVLAVRIGSIRPQLDRILFQCRKRLIGIIMETMGGFLLVNNFLLARCS